MNLKAKEFTEDNFFSTDLAKKANPIFKKEKIYTISRKRDNTRSRIKSKLKVFFVKEYPTKDKVIHYLFKSIEGGYNISYTNLEILQGSVKVA